MAGANHEEVGILLDSAATLAWSSATVMNVITAFLRRRLDSATPPK
ncbi:hypothetical protein JHN63_29620 [Streptomyces sp. MBT65]|nr:hypothetical protein [Streptomyces sp. MBT65]MBK3577885.1 hypothetical protein [Streptomyces sp. MBT65]